MTEKTAWKQFEELVAQMERVLQPMGAVVTSPDNVPDIVAGIPREVDATIRLPDGQLVTVECRDRSIVVRGARIKARQDVCWIEQLVTKRSDIGATKTIGVSAGGFTEAAIAKAKHYDIELRQMSQISDAEIARQWVGSFRISVRRPYYVLGILGITGLDGIQIQVDELSEEIVEGFKTDATTTPFLKMKNLEPLVSAEHIFNTRVPHSEWLKRDGEFGIAVEVSSKSDDELGVMTPEGIRPVRRVIFSYSVETKEIVTDVLNARRYSSMDEPLLDQIETVADLGDVTLHTTFSGRLYKPFTGQDQESP